MIKIIFINVELGFDSGYKTLVGQSGKFYGGPSVFNREHVCQSIETQFETERDYVAAMKDLALKWGMYGEKWIPIPVFPKPTTFVQQGSPAVKTPFVEVPIATATDDLNAIDPTIIPYEVGAVDRTEAINPNHVDSSTPYKKLVRVAAEMGVNITGCTSNAERAAAINAKRSVTA